MKQVKEQSPKKYEFASLFQDKNVSPSLKQTSKQQIEGCDNFKQFIDNIPLQMLVQQGESLSLANENSLQSPSINQSKFEVNFQKEVNALLKRQTPYKYEGNEKNNQATQKQKEILQNISNAVTSKQYSIKEDQHQDHQQIQNKDPFVNTNQDQMKGNFIDLINHQKKLISKQLFLNKQSGNDKQQSPSKKQLESNQMEKKDILSFQQLEEEKNDSKEVENVFQKQSIFNDSENICQDNQKIPQNIEIQESNQQNITNSQNQEQITLKKSNSYYQQEIYNQLINKDKDMQKINSINKQQIDFEPRQSYNLQIRSGSVGDILNKQKIIQNGLSLNQSSQIKQQNNKQALYKNIAKICDKKYDVFSQIDKNNISNVKCNTQQQHIIKQDNFDKQQNTIGQIKLQPIKNQEFKNISPQVFLKTRMLSQQKPHNQLSQIQKISNRGSENEGEVNMNESIQSKEQQIQINETFQNQQYNSNDKLDLSKQQNSQEQSNNILNLDLISTIQSSQEGINVKNQTQYNNISSPIQQTTEGSLNQQNTIQSPFQQNTTNSFQQTVGNSLFYQTNSSSSQQNNPSNLHQQNTSSSTNKIESIQHQQNNEQNTLQQKPRDFFQFQKTTGSSLFQQNHGKNYKQQIKKGGNSYKNNSQNNILSSTDFKKNNNFSLDKIIQFNQIVTNSLSKNWNQLNVAPNLIEKRKNYANELRNVQISKNNDTIKRIHSQPSVISKSYNPSLTTSINNSPLPSAKNKHNKQKSSTILLNQPINQLEQYPQTLAHFSLPDSCHQTPIQTNRKSSNNSNNSINDLQTEGSKKQLLNHPNSHYSSIASTKNQIQRISSTTGFQNSLQKKQEHPTLRNDIAKFKIEPLKLKSGRPRSSGFKGKKLFENTKYSFISAFPNNRQQKSMNTSQSQDFKKCFTINNSIYANEEMSYQANESLRISQNKEVCSSLLQSSDILNQISYQDEKRKQNSGGQLNSTNSIKSTDIEYNKSTQDKSAKNQSFNKRLLVAKQSKEMITASSHQRTTQTQIQKDLMKSRTSNKQIIKGSFAHKLTPEQSSFINQIQKPKNQDQKQNTNQIQEKSIRQELLENLQKKIEVKQNSFIKLQTCQNQTNINASEGIQQREDIKTLEKQQQNDIKFSQDVKQTNQKAHDLKIQQLDPIEEKQVTKIQGQVQPLNEQEYDEEDSIEAQDEHTILKLIQESENDSPYNYIGFSSEKNQNLNRDKNPSFGYLKSKQSKTQPDIYKMSNASFGNSEKININQNDSQEKNFEQNFIKKQYDKIQNNMNKQNNYQNNKSNSTNSSAKKPNKIQMKEHQVINYDMDYLELPDQVTLGQNSNKGKDLFNISYDNFHSDQKLISHPVHVSSQSYLSDDFNTQTFQKRNNSQNTIQQPGKQITIQETPKFTFQMI